MTDSAQLIYGIANYVYIDSWCDINRHIHSNPCVNTLGIHPHRILPNLAKFLINKLKIKLSQHPDVLGIGEVGLDCKTSCRCTTIHNYSMDICRDRKAEEQKQFLGLVFQLFKQQEDKVLVLHVRDNGNGKAAEKVLSLPKEYGLQNARIHRHCFVGKEEEYQDWRKTLPNCYFSISRKSLRDIGTATWLLL